MIQLSFDTSIVLLSLSFPVPVIWKKNSVVRSKNKQKKKEKFLALHPGIRQPKALHISLCPFFLQLGKREGGGKKGKEEKGVKNTKQDHSSLATSPKSKDSAAKLRFTETIYDATLSKEMDENYYLVSCQFSKSSTKLCPFCFHVV